MSITSWVKSVTNPRQLKLLLIAIGLSLIVAIPILGYVSVSGLAFSQVHGKRWAHNTTIYFNIEFFITLEKPLLTTTVTNPKFVMAVGYLDIGLLAAIGGDIPVIGGLVLHPLYYNLTFSWDENEVAEFCSVPFWSYIQNPEGSAYWSFRMTAEARAGLYQTQVLVRSAHFGCHWGN